MDNTSVDQMLETLSVIEQTDLADLVRALNVVFTQITKMDESQTIAAWQTLDLCVSHLPVGDEKLRIIEKLQKAIVDRMAKIARTGLGMESSKAFEDVTGRTFSYV